MSTLRTHRFVALSIVALGVGLAPCVASASQCECTVTEQPVASTACAITSPTHCEKIEDCTSVVPFSREVRLDIARFEHAAAPRSSRLSWCEGPNDPECSSADPDRNPQVRVGLSVACTLPDDFAPPATAGSELRSTTHTEIVSRLAGNTPVHRLDRPPR